MRYSIYGLAAILVTLDLCILFPSGVYGATDKNTPGELTKSGPSMEDVLIGTSLKTLAKVFISARDKTELISKLYKMDDDKFIRTSTGRRHRCSRQG